VKHGKDPATPAAIVARGTTPSAEVRRGTLAELGDLAVGLPSPALVVIGEVAALRLVEGANVAAAQLA
jgi:uroporphyrin-III C-methyltransferase/precorrin-2 dehydrogenase/sirohydrochlorin ferrochelatase